MKKKLHIAMVCLLFIAFVTSLSPVYSFAVMDVDDYEVVLFDAEKDEFGDSPQNIGSDEDSVSSAEIAGHSTDTIMDVRERISSISNTTSGSVDDDNPVSIGTVSVGNEDGESKTDEARLQSGASISFSTDKLCISRGAVTTVYITVNNFEGNAYIAGSITNSSVCSAYFGDANGSTIALIVTGTNPGDSSLDFQVTQNGRTIATNRMEVTVLTAERPKITVSNTSLNIAKNTRATVTVSHNQYGANVYVGWEWSDNSVINCDWGGWNSSQTSFPFYVDGWNSGNASIKLGLYNRFDQLLAYTYISPVKVYEASNPSITISTTSVRMYTGETSRVRVTVNGMTGSWYLNVNYPSTCSARWQQVSDNVYDLYIGGNTPLSRSALIELKDTNDRTLRTATFSIDIISRASPKIVFSRSKIDVAAGSREMFNITVTDCNVEYYLHLERSSSIFGINWGDWNGNTISCAILGYSSYYPPVSATLTVQLCRASDNAVLDTKILSVRIVAASTPPMAFGFENYSQPDIPLSTCQIIFGNGQRAKTVYGRDYGNGGVCFGMSTASALIYHGIGELGLRNFSGNPGSIYGLSQDISRTNPNNFSVNLNLKQIIEAMHVSQYSNHYTRTTGVSSVASKIVSEINQGRVISVGVRGDYNGDIDCGHRVLAYGYSYPSSKEMLVKIYDPNSRNMSTLSFTRSSDSGNYTAWYFSNFDWGTGKPNASINCIALDSISYIWNNRGSLILRLFSLDETEQDRRNLFVTSEKSFELYAYDAENPLSNGTLMIRCRDGVVQYLHDDVSYIENWGILPDGTSKDYDFIFYLPIDYYTFKDLSPENGVEAVLSDDDYSVKVSTDSHLFDFYAEDSTSTVGALVSADEGDVYQISIGSCVAAEPDQYNYSGIGTGEIVSIFLENGELGTSGMKGASVSITTDEPARYYSVYDGHTVGGSVIYADGRNTDLAEGDSCMVQFVSDEGYQIYNVCIDDTDYGNIDSFSFTDIMDNHQIYVDFRRNIAECSVMLAGYDDEAEPVFVLTNRDGEELVANEDYSYSRLADESDNIIFLANEDSAYTGALVYTMDEDQPEIVFASIDKNQVVNIRLSSAISGSTVFSAFYNENGEMLSIQSIDVNQEELSLDFSGFTFPPACHISVFWVDKNFKPLCNKQEIQ